MNEKNIMEQVIEESDRMNIVGALDAFMSYINVKRDTASDRTELQSQLNQIKKTIDSAQYRVSQYAITDRAIALAEEIQTLSAMDRLFIHFLADPHGVDMKEITDEAWGDCAVIIEYNDDVRTLPQFLGKYSDCKAHIDEMPGELLDAVDGGKYIIIRKPTHIVMNDKKIEFCGQKDDCTSIIDTKYKESDTVSLIQFNDTMVGPQANIE